MPKHSTRIGEWYDALLQKIEEEELLTYRKKHCLSVSQRFGQMVSRSLRPTSLTLSEFVTYGQQIQIKNIDFQPEKPLYISVSMDEYQIQTNLDFHHGCRVVASTFDKPCVRNTFTFVCSDPTLNKDNSLMTYEDDCYIQLSTVAGTPLYLEVLNPTVDTLGETSVVSLTKHPSMYCKFKLSYWHAEFRYVNFRTIYINSRALIQHTASGLYLCVENSKIPTLLGTMNVLKCKYPKDYTNRYLPGAYWKICA